MITLRQKESNIVKECSTGYSWTTFFFGMFVPLFRGDLKWAAIFFCICFLVGLFTAGIGSVICGPVFAYFYNKIYITGLVEKGYVAMDELSQDWLVRNGVVSNVAKKQDEESKAE